MKILFINSLQSDYLEDMMFSGLVHILGKHNVVSYPINYHYYFSRYTYPRNMGQCIKARYIIPDYLFNKRNIKRADFDLVVLGSTKKDVFQNFLLLEKYLPKSIPVIYIDGGDWPDIGGDAERLGWKSLFQQVNQSHKFSHIFKREYITGNSYPKNTHPLPFGYRGIDIQQPLVKKYDVVFWAVESHPVRTTALQMLQNQYDCNTNGTIKGQVFKHYARKAGVYLEELSSAKIAINLRGGGWDTLRYWEIPAAGTLMVSGKPGITIPNNFIDQKHVIFTRDDLADLLDKLDYFLKHENEREEIAANARKYLFEHHTYLHRARYMLDIIKN